LISIAIFCCGACNHVRQDNLLSTGACDCEALMDSCSVLTRTSTVNNMAKGGLLGTRFQSLDELKRVIQINYSRENSKSGSKSSRESKVCIRHCSNGTGIISELECGISQGDIAEAQKGDLWTKLKLLISSPFVVANRVELSKVYLLARRRTDLFGEGDPAFYDLAEVSAKNINTVDIAYISSRDSTEKGYLNSFNHITAQAFITSCFSEKLADFVGDAHERYYHPDLITGKFSEEQVKDLDEGPVDNYVDVVNNEWGQELGKILKGKYGIDQSTYWSPELLANYLNDLQSYYSWAFQIGFRPVRSEDEVVIRFSNKLNVVMSKAVRIEKI
jgi:hypothetical protein